MFEKEDPKTSEGNEKKVYSTEEFLKMIEKERYSMEELIEIIEKEVEIRRKKSKEALSEMIKMEIEISGRDNKEENGVMKINEGLRDEIISYLHNKFEIKGLEEGEELSLYFYGGDLYLNVLEPEGEVSFSWLIEDKEIINKIEKLIS